VTTVVVMAKEPVPGRVKTRLCPPCTTEEAATLASAALEDTMQAVGATSCTTRVLALDGCLAPWARPGWSLLPQTGGDLAARLGAAAGSVAAPSLLIGMDTPQVTPAMLDDACTRLQAPGVDAVLGLADDGGYWAIGFRARRPGAFDGVAMSTPDTGRQQLTRLEDLGLRVDLLPKLRDVDTITDAAAVAADAPGSRFARAFRSLPAQR
jgi:rSAM/selenodomain-associated transferase 1